MGPESKTSNQVRKYGPVVLLILLSYPIIFYNLGQYSIVNGDEGVLYEIARNMIREGNFFHLEYFGWHKLYDTFITGPLHYWVNAVLILVFGDSLWTMRILSAFFGLATVLLLYRVGIYLVGRRAGLLSALVLLSSVQFIYLHSARTGEKETLLTFIILLAAYLFLRACEQGKSFVPNFICLMTIPNLKLPVVIMPLAAEFFYLLITPNGRGRLKEWLKWGTILMTLSLSWHIVSAFVLWEQLLGVMQTVKMEAAGGDGQKIGFFAQIIENMRYYGFSILFGNFPYVLAFPLAIFAVFKRAMSEPQQARWRVIRFFPLAIFLFFIFISKKHNWYIVPTLPFLALFLGVWMDRILNRDVDKLDGFFAAAVLSALCWLRVDIPGFNPFVAPERMVPMDIGFRDILGIPGRVGLILSIIAIELIYVQFPKRWLRRLNLTTTHLMIVALFVIGFLRVLCPLSYTRYQSSLPQLSRNAYESLRKREELTYPIPIYEKGYLRVRFYFNDQFIVLPARETNAEFEVWPEEQRH